jgi:hypothetical protein
MNSKPEVWLRGPLDKIPGLLQPVAHALLQAMEEVNAIMDGFPDVLLWERPVGLASPGFHLQHLKGVLDRLFTYAKGELLDQQQLDRLSSEGKPDGKYITAADLVKQFDSQVDVALLQLQNENESSLAAIRGVGRSQLKSTVIGLYVHAAEHTMRHLGQLLVTVKVLKDR